MTPSLAGIGVSECEKIVRGWCVRRGEEDTLCRILLTQGLELLMCREAGAIFQTQGRVSKTCLLVVREEIEMEEDLLGCHTRSQTTDFGTKTSCGRLRTSPSLAVRVFGIAELTAAAQRDAPG